MDSEEFKAAELEQITGESATVDYSNRGELWEESHDNDRIDE